MFWVAPELVPPLLRGMLQALGQLHHQRTAHGDLKPGQYMLAVEGAAAAKNPGNVRLGDLNSCSNLGEPPYAKSALNGLPRVCHLAGRQQLRYKDRLQVGAQVKRELYTQI